jgi:hypothetical protein
MMQENILELTLMMETVRVSESLADLNNVTPLTIR